MTIDDRLAAGPRITAISLSGIGRLLATALVAFAAAVCAPAGAQEAPASGNLVTNGDFMAGMAPWWGPNVSRANLSRADGRQHLKLKGGYAVQEKIPVRDDTAYRLSVAVRSTDAPPNSVFVQISFRGEGVEPVWYGNLDIDVGDHMEKAVLITGGTHDWIDMSTVVGVPKGADQMLVYLRKFPATPGVAQYADVVVEATDETPLDAEHAERRRAAAPLFAGAGHVDDPAAAIDRLVAMSASGPHLLAAGGEPRVGLHMAADADFVTIGAVTTLADGLARITGADFRPVGDDARPLDRPLIVVGREGALARRLVQETEFEGLGADGFLIRSVGPHIVIAGAGERGTLYGVNWFLDRVLGVRWLGPDVEHWPSDAAPVVDRLDVRQVPRFAYREVLASEAEDKGWRAHNLMNGDSHGPSYRPTPREIDVFNRSWRAQDGYGNFYELLPRAKYGILNPNWYVGGQLAMMNPALRKAMAEEIVARMKALPDYRRVWFAVHDMDWGWDMDPESAAFAKAHGGNPSAPRLDMMIDVAERVRAELPGARLAFNAYHWSFAPPEGMTVPDHLLVYPMTIQVNYRAALQDPENAELAAGIEGWNRIARNVLVWDHVVNFDGFIQPTPNLRAIARSIKWLAGLENVRGYFAEGAWDTPAAEFTELRAWLIARLLWNPDEDVDAAIRDFTGAYYGPAGEMIYDYISLSEAAAERAGLRLTEKLPAGAADYDLAFFREADALFARAAAAVEGTPYEPRVREARMAVDYLVLARRGAIAAEAEAAGEAFDVDREARTARLMRAVEESGLRGARQGAGREALEAFLEVERGPAGPPEFAAASGLAEGTDWVDLQDGVFILYDRSAYVMDDAASDGVAARLAPESRGWITQMKLDRLPREGRWRLYAAARVRGDGEGARPAIEVGSYPPMSCATTARLDGAGGDWRYVEIPGGPMAYDEDHNVGLYMRVASPPEAGEILVDRIVAVRDGAGVDPAQGTDAQVSCRVN